jgi:hypothetical protein
MARRIRHTHIGERLADAGHEPSRFTGGDWDPGYRTAQAGTRLVHVFHDGPGETEHLAAYTRALREIGYTWPSSSRNAAAATASPSPAPEPQHRGAHPI